MPSMDHDAHAFAPLRRLGVACTVAAASAALAFAIGTGSAGAAPNVTVLGAAAPATPACPAECRATGKTTGFQTSIGKTKNPFVVTAAGKIVAWSIKLSAPNANQIEFFDDTFGGTAKARISVLKPIQKKIKRGKRIYKLKSQSPVEDLRPYFGSTTTFTLQAPLTVKKNQIVALTIPTWAPAFAVNQPGRTTWRASRKRCSDKAVPDGRPHEALATNRLYRCSYKGTRLLYSATFVKRPGR